MTRFAPILATIAAPCFADPSAHWGASSATLAPCHAADACVTVINRLSAAPDIAAVVIDLDGLAVEVIAVMGAGTEPDRVQIRPPVGWLVMPGWADVPEDGAVVFQLFAPMVG
jgi:hypothetical protein